LLNEGAENPKLSNPGTPQLSKAGKYLFLSPSLQLLMFRY